MLCLCVCVAQWPWRSEESALDPLELGLLMVLNARNQISVLGKSSMCSRPLSHFSGPDLDLWCVWCCNRLCHFRRREYWFWFAVSEMSVQYVREDRTEFTLVRREVEVRRKDEGGDGENDQWVHRKIQHWWSLPPLRAVVKYWLVTPLPAERVWRTHC